MTASGTTLSISSLPPAPGSCDVKVTVNLSDGTQAFGQLRIEWTTAAGADRIFKLCQIMHVVSQAPLSNIPFGPATDPLRLEKWAENAEKMLEPRLVVKDLLASLSELPRTLSKSNASG